MAKWFKQFDTVTQVKDLYLLLYLPTPGEAVLGSSHVRGAFSLLHAAAFWVIMLCHLCRYLLHYGYSPHTFITERHTIILLSLHWALYYTGNYYEVFSYFLSCMWIAIYQLCFGWLQVLGYWAIPVHLYEVGIHCGVMPLGFFVYLHKEFMLTLYSTPHWGFMLQEGHSFGVVPCSVSSF